ncbi:MAG: hypothetical protein ACE5LU_06580 [Anaerolineae bacterium]
MRRQYTFENEFWVFFGYGIDWEPGRCDRCYRRLESTNAPPPEAIDCWKLEIFFSNCTDLEAVKQYFLDAGRKDPTLHGKWLKQEMEIPGDKLTSIPAAGHPDPDVKRDGAILIYTTSIAERDARRAKILADLKARGLYRKDAISSRRGCVNFDEIIGPWTEWYDLEQDYVKERD